MSDHHSDSPENNHLRQHVRRLIDGTGRPNVAASSAVRLIAPLYVRMEAIERRLDALSRQLQSVGATADPDDTVAQETLAALEQQVSRAGHEQVKVNALVKTQVEELTTTLEVLRTECMRRDMELALLREQNQAAQEKARLEVVEALLPALDGIDEALQAGPQLTVQPPSATPPMTPFERMRAHTTALQQSGAIPPETLSAWRMRLEQVRQRLLDVLANVGVQPMNAQGQPFDPQLHLALEFVPPSEPYPAGTVVSELRRGYLVGNRVLRPAEVVLSGEAHAHQPGNAKQRTNR